MKQPWIVAGVAVLLLFVFALAALGTVSFFGLRALRQRTMVDVPVTTSADSPAEDSSGVAPDFARATSVAPGVVNRLLIQGVDGNLFTARPDGTDMLPLTSDASASRLYQQPTWSPAADRVAWSRADVVAGASTSAVLTSRLDGTAKTEADTQSFTPFYIAWSPDGASLAYLSNWTDGLALRWVDLAMDGGAATTLDSGQPFYFSWAPDGLRLLTHGGPDGLDVLSITGDRQSLGLRPGLFGAPQWGRADSQLVVAVREGRRQRLLLVDVDGRTQQEITEFRGNISFSLSPDGSRIAYVDTTSRVFAAAFGPLAIVDLETAERIQITNRPVFSFFWSPDGRSLLYLGLDEQLRGMPQASLVTVQDAPLSFQWFLWDGATAREIGRVAPSDVFLRQYLRYFDQYTRSMTPWAPDSSAFVYAGIDADGADAIWVQAVDGARVPERVAAGVFAAWSPR